MNIVLQIRRCFVWKNFLCLLYVIVVSGFSMERKTIDTVLLLFTLITACIALVLLFVVLLKNRCCPRKSIYANTETFEQFPNNQQLSITPKLPLRYEFLGDITVFSSSNSLLFVAIFFLISNI